MTDLHHSRESGAALTAWLKEHPEAGNIRQLGEELGINYSALRHYFAGHSFPRGDALVKLRHTTHLEVLNQVPARHARRPVTPVTIPSAAPVKVNPPDQAQTPAGSFAEKEDSRKLKLLVVLRTWIGRHPEIGRPGLARGLGVSERTVQSWVTGRYYPGPNTLKAIERVTGISFGSTGPTLAGVAGQPGPAPSKASGTEAQIAANALLQVLRALEPVVQGPPARRKALQEAFSREGAGYLTAALTALYSSEEDFQTWKYFAHPRTGDSR
jgi:transcriptional regulator with XRE-family HTH domain